ncbi:1,2-epoxyphenylacetyl-CoA isomerase [Zhongshania aliphaticivorans]|uniref:1,2-epoxyphenylacetyl-CoA isomerase n=1 Tax=Zhongshania aliphaticivorans TaxID=1470434 RepID=A0A5S9Q0K8_9GAMM|nr:enoyl-CoA hydratase-related protein [Zhongshania aliphaticivorans]CAA0110569.1 1,2-epoxyphenylacetyl-CoA isomerase [Zhongshania aliphaticivorans]CAA0118187.1 1,2-epoxyphenylacetyl-CoA isomerase [Zhongshania aliphaticivorans]CAA0122200.1 1,2-epoxyphenylacetyl-CoA isomerase [Zhongshania aliphaticivorans]
MMTDTLLVKTHYDSLTRVAEIVFHRESVLNAINVQLASEFAAVVDELYNRSDVRCLVIRGAGRAFMAGGDVAEFVAAGESTPAVVDKLLDALNPTILKLRAMPCPVLAVCQGAVAGAGLSLLAACDLVIAADSSRFMMAYDKIGGPPDCGGSYLLSQLLGERLVNELMFTGAVWTAAEAKQNGLVSRIVNSEEILACTEEWVEQLAAGPTKAYAAYKNLRNSRYDHSLETHLEIERKAFKVCSLSADFREGTAAFSERRPAKFIGR